MCKKINFNFQTFFLNKLTLIHLLIIIFKNVRIKFIIIIIKIINLKNL